MEDVSVEERFPYIARGLELVAEARKKQGIKEETGKAKERKIIALSCGKKNGSNETYLRAAAMGAEEYGIKTEIIRAAELKVKACTGCAACSSILTRGKLSACPIKDDDVPWILEQTVLGDNALIVAAPIYYVRSNAIFMAICERMHPTMFSNLDILKKGKVGAIISVGGGKDGWASLGLTMLNIWVQHFATVVDQVSVEMRLRNIDWHARATELGRNVARAMLMPIEEVAYMGPKTALTCPICHCDILQVPDESNNVYCPVCWVRGAVSIDNGKMKVEWDEWDKAHARFSEYGVFVHLNDEIIKLQDDRARQDPGGVMAKEIQKKYSAYGKVIKPRAKA